MSDTISVKSTNAIVEDKSAGWYINEQGEKIDLCSAVDAVQFGLEFFWDDKQEFYDFMEEWSHGTIEEYQEEFNKWKERKHGTAS